MTEYFVQASLILCKKKTANPHITFPQDNTSRLQLSNSPNIIQLWPSSQPAVLNQPPPAGFVVIIYFDLVMIMIEDA